MKPARLQQFRPGRRLPPNTRSVARPSRWGNPFRPSARTAEAHAACVEAYRHWLYAPAQTELRQQARRLLRDKNLACYCPPDWPCHADVLLEMVNQEKEGGE
jgi:hypothetical protein